MEEIGTTRKEKNVKETHPEMYSLRSLERLDSTTRKHEQASIEKDILTRGQEKKSSGF